MKESARSLLGAARTIGRVLIPLAGVALVVALVRDAGPSHVTRVLREAGPWVPLIFVLETAQIVADFTTLRSILGPSWRTIPLRTRVRACTVAYAMMILLPAGRAAGEVARGALFAKYIGARRSAAASARLQAVYILGNGVISAADFVVVGLTLGWGAPLTLLLAANTVLMLAVAGTLWAILWDGRVGRWLDGLRRRFQGGGGEGLEEHESNRALPWRGVAICSTVRFVQVIQYGVIVCAVGGVASLRPAFVAHGIHLVAATVGDVVPNQLGVVDGAYRAFAGVIGFAGAPARALSIAFVERIAQLTLALVCVIVAAALQPRAEGGRALVGRARTSRALARGDDRSWPVRGRIAERSFRRTSR
jgi:hypothetical protein